MAIHLMRDIAKRSIATLGTSGFRNAGIVFSNRIQSQQWRALPSPQFLCRYCSSSPRSKTSFVGWYLHKLDSRPILTKAISSSLIYAASDYTSQLITASDFASFDPIRTLRMAAYGLLILGPSQHLWFGFLSKVLPKRDLLTTLKKIFMGQAIFGPFITTVFFSYNAGLQGENGDEIVARLKRDLVPTLINGVMFWPVCDYIMFKFVPVGLQPLMNSSCAYLWTIYLTYMASLGKVAKE